MITKLIFAVLLALPNVAAAQEKLADQLRKAIVEEEVNQKLDKAIEAYTKILAQYDEDRKIAATALFHFAECCRKLGQKEQAIAAYKQLLRDFADQTALADASRNNLSQYGIRPAKVSTEQVAQARMLQDLIMLVEKQIQDVEKRVQIGVAKPDEIIPLKKELIELKLRMEAMRKGIVQPQK